MAGPSSSGSSISRWRRSRCASRWWRVSEVSEVVVSRPPPIRFHSAAASSSSVEAAARRRRAAGSTRRRRRGRAGRRGRGAGDRPLAELGQHAGHVGDGASNSGLPGPVGDGAVEQVGVVAPVVERQADQLHGEDGGHRVGRSSTRSIAPGLDPLVEEPGGGGLHQRSHAAMAAGDEERVDDPAQRARGPAPRPRRCPRWGWPAPGDAGDAEVVDAVVGLGRVPARERLAVAGHGGHLVVAADHPEAAVARVERHRAPPQLGPLGVAVGVELGAVVVELDGGGGVASACGPPERGGGGGGGGGGLILKKKTFLRGQGAAGRPNCSR